MEDRVNKFLRRQNHPEAGEVFVRVVASSDKTVEVKPGMKSRLVLLITINAILKSFCFEVSLHKYCETMPICTLIPLHVLETYAQVKLGKEEEQYALSELGGDSKYSCILAGFRGIARDVLIWVIKL